MLSRYKLHGARHRWPRLLPAAVIVFAVLILGIGSLWWMYNTGLKPASASQHRILITIPKNSSVRGIGKLLKNAGVIRSDTAFEWYVRSHGVYGDLQAGTYSLSPSQSVSDIVAILAQGKIASDLVTILPGQRLDQIRQALLAYGYSKTAVNAALAPDRYKGHPALVGKPEGASLEGYLYPESFQKTANTLPNEIVRKSLDQMQKHLTPQIRDAISKQGLSVYQGIVLASIVEQEVSKPADRPVVAQVFFKRLRMGMVLGSDVTAYYGAIAANRPPSLSFDSSYNTLLHPGLPPGPISNVSDNSLQAVAHPAATDYLYFVSGDDGMTYFSHTLAEHQALTAEHCKKLCATP